MKNPPRTHEEAKKYYNHPDYYHPQFYEPKRCAWEVVDKGGDGQCFRKPGHGPEGLYCWQHARMVEGEE